ncbi:MAG TPA: hypothetical protein VGZ03_05825 [Acidimicrobiales bacterium]|nr:hypothetical protein [Acidimicrobiales bacterium]
MLRPRFRTWRCAAACGVTLALAVAAPAGGAARSPHHARHTIVLAPRLGLPGIAVRVSGSGVPKHLRLTVLFDVTTKDKVRLCTTTNGASTRWRCTGRLPAHAGALGPHTVEMDATTLSGKGGFEELSTFLVTDLGVLLAAPASTAPGDTVALRVTASNGNAVRAHGVLVTDRLPSGLRLQHATAPCKLARGVVSCGPFRMGARTSRVFVLTTIVTVAHRARLFDAVTIRGAPDPLRRNDVARISLAVT